MVVADPRQQLEPRILTLVEDQVEQHGSHPLVFEERHRLRRRGRPRGPVAEVVQVDSQLLLHRRLVLDDQHGRAEHVGRPVDLKAGRQRRKPHLAISRLPLGSTSAASVCQGQLYITLNDY
jgi:hypothetical protein